jgi:hypothetical protein
MMSPQIDVASIPGRCAARCGHVLLAFYWTAPVERNQDFRLLKKVLEPFAVWTLWNAGQASGAGGPASRVARAFVAEQLMLVTGRSMCVRVVPSSATDHRR